MGDDDDGVALLLHPAQDAEELLDLLHGEDGGGLVQDDDLGPIAQDLDNLQGLLFGHRHICHFFSGIQDEAKFFRHLLYLEKAVPPQQQAGLLLAHPDVVGRGEHVHQLKVLVDHPDTQPFGVLRGIDGHQLPLHQNISPVRLINAGEHIHQGGLSRAIFPQQGQNLPLAQVQVHILVGRHAAEDLGNAPHFNGIGLLRHWPHSF